MNTLEEYLTVIKPQIKSAVDNALPYMALDLSDSIEEAAMSEVYSYPATMQAMVARRYTIGAKENTYLTLGNYQIKMENKAVMHSGEANEVRMVEEGWGGKYRQPGPRPFMQLGLDNYIESGKGEDELAYQLRAAGFTVI